MVGENYFRGSLCDYGKFGADLAKARIGDVVESRIEWLPGENIENLLKPISEVVGGTITIYGKQDGDIRKFRKLGGYRSKGLAVMRYERIE